MKGFCLAQPCCMLCSRHSLYELVYMGWLFAGKERYIIYTSSIHGACLPGAAW